MTNSKGLTTKNEKRLKAMQESDIDFDRIANARRFIYTVSCEGWWGNGDTAKMLDEAIKDISRKELNILNNFYACKNLNDFSCVFDTCQYGHAPTHGYVVLSIRATGPWRKGEIIANDNDLRDMLYYLKLLKPDSKLLEQVLAFSC